jgi:hypothetical protein
MPQMTSLAKAELRELDANFAKKINPDKATKVQFNPETLKVSFANQVATPPGGSSEPRGTAGMQFVGAGTTKLSLQIWFDVTGEVPEGLPKVDDVRKLTQRVTYFITPHKVDDPSATSPQFLPPAVRFLWGSFLFDGVMDSLEESLEFFSNDGRPLRASMSLSLSQQKIQVVFNPNFSPGAGGAGGLGGAPVGTTPLVQATAGATFQGLAASAGAGGNWQALAAANGIENPRLLQPGQLLNLSGSASAGVTAGVNVAGPRFGASASVSF